MVTAIVRLCTNCPSLRHSINLACLKIFRWWEIVAGVTPRKLARSPQVRISVAAVASNIANRVLSASAFDMFSICFVSITVPSVQVSSLPPISRGRRGLSTHLVLASVVPVAASEPKRSMGQYANTARPEIKRLATGPKTRESFELMR